MMEETTKVYVLYDALLGPVMRTDQKQIKKQYLNQYVKKPDSEQEHFIELDVRDFSRENRQEIMSIPEPYFVGEYILTQSQFEMHDQGMSQFYTEMDYSLKNFLGSLQYLKFSQDELEVIFGLLDLFRPIMEIRLADEYDVEVDIDDFIDLSSLLINLYKFKEAWELK